MACRQQTVAALLANAASQPAPVTTTLSLRKGLSSNTHRPPSEPTYSCDNARNSSTLLSDRPAKTLHDPLSGVHDAAHTTGGQVAAEPDAGHGEPAPLVSLPVSPPLPTFTVAPTGPARNFSRRLTLQSQPITLTRSSSTTDETSASRSPLLSCTVSSWPSVIDDSPPPSLSSSNSFLEPPSKDTESSTPHRLSSAQRSPSPVACPVSLLHTSSAESSSVAKAGPALLFSDTGNNHNNNGDSNEKEAEKKKKKQIHQQRSLYNPSRVPSHSPLSIGTTFVLPELDLDLDLNRLYGGYFDRTVDTEQLVAMTTSPFQYTPPFQPPLPPPPPYSEPSAGGRLSSPDLGFPRSGVDGFSSPTTNSLHHGDSPRQFRNSQHSTMTQPTPAQSFSRKVSTKIRGFLNHTHRSRSPSSRNSTATVATVSEDSHISSSLPVANDNKGSKDVSPVVVPVVAAVTTTVTAPVTTSVVEPVSSAATTEVSANAAVDDFMDAHTTVEVPVVMPMMDAVDDRLKPQESQTFDGDIPIMNGCQPDSGVRSGRSSYLSLDSPTLATESSGNPSNRNSFRSFVQEERPRSRSPESPVTPDDDYRFNNRMPDSRPNKSHIAAELQTEYSRDEESTHDGVESQVVPVYLDERNESGNGIIPSLLIETASSPCRLHPDHPESFMTPRPAPRSPRNRPASMRSRSPSPAPIMSALKSLLPESGRETPSFLTPRPAPTTPIPSPGCGPIKPLRSPTEAGPRLLRASTMSSRSAGANPSRAPLSLNPRVRSHLFPYVRPSTAANSISEVRSFREVSSLNRVLPPPERLKEHDEISIISLGPPSSPNQLHDIEHNFPPMPMPNYATSLRKSGSIRSASGRALEIAVPPPLDSRSMYDSRSMFDGRSILETRSILGARSVENASPTTTVPDDFKSMASPKYPDDDAPLSPTVYSPDIDMIETDPPPRTPPAEPEMAPTLLPAPASEFAPALEPALVLEPAAAPALVAAQAPPPPEVKRHNTVSKGLRRAFSRRKSTNKRTTGPITGDLISRPSTSATATSVDAIPGSELLDDNRSVRSRSMMSPLISPPSSPTASVSRWRSVRGRSSSTSSASAAYSQSPAVLPLKFKLASVPETAKLTQEELIEIARMPGTIFIRTSMAKEGANPDSTREEDIIIQKHRMKPRKGMAGTGAAGSCRFCGKGPFVNMWVCMDVCQFVMCRMCANEKVQAGEAELF